MRSLNNLLYIFLVFVISIMGVTGCATTGDPTKGGIFWSETKAKERICNLEAKKNNEEAIAQQERQESLRLNKTSQNLEAEIQNQQNQLATMDSRLNQLNRELTQKKILSASKQAERKKLENRLNTLNKEVAALQKTRSRNARSIAEKKKRIEELNEEIYQSLELLQAL